MSTIRNPTNFSLFSHKLGRSLEAGEVLDGIDEATAEEVCRTGVFELGVLVPEEVTVTVNNDDTDEEETDDEDESPKRGRGRPRSVRGSLEVEEVVDDDEDSETR